MKDLWYLIFMITFSLMLLIAYYITEMPKKPCSLRAATPKEYMDCFNGFTTGFDNGDCNHACEP